MSVGTKIELQCLYVPTRRDHCRAPALPGEPGRSTGSGPAPGRSGGRGDPLAHAPAPSLPPGPPPSGTREVKL